MSFEHTGGECPYTPDSIVSVTYRNGKIETGRAQDFRWFHIEDVEIHSPWFTREQCAQYDIVKTQG